MKVKLILRYGKVERGAIEKQSQSRNEATPSEDIISIDLKHDMTSWAYICKDQIDSTDQEVSSIVYQTEITSDMQEAKLSELDNLCHVKSLKGK